MAKSCVCRDRQKKGRKNAGFVWDTSADKGTGQPETFYAFGHLSARLPVWAPLTVMGSQKSLIPVHS